MIFARRKEASRIRSERGPKGCTIIMGNPVECDGRSRPRHVSTPARLRSHLRRERSIDIDERIKLSPKLLRGEKRSGSGGRKRAGRKSLERRRALEGAGGRQ